MDKNDVFQYPEVEIQKLNGEVKSIDCPARMPRREPPWPFFRPQNKVLRS